MSILSDSDINFHCRWSNSSELLSDYVHKTQLPSIVRIKSGLYEQFGDKKKYHNALFIHSSKSEVYALAENQMSNGKNSLFAIPLLYPGWFELLNESKRTLKPLSFGKELINNKSNVFLVRKKFRVKCLDDSKETNTKYKLLCVGEIIYFHQKQPVSDFSEKEESYISCKDEKGNFLFISLKQKIFLSPISDSDEFLGVYSIRDLCEKYVFPISIQLAFGEYQGSYKFFPIFKLFGFSRLSTVIVTPLNHPSLVTNMPINELVLVEGIKNVEEIKKSPKWAKLTEEAEEKKALAETTMFSVVPGRIKIYKGGKNKENFCEIDNSLVSTYDEINDIYRYIRDGVYPNEKQNKKYSLKNEINDKTHMERNIMIDLPVQYIDVPWKEPSYEGVFEVKKLESKMQKNEKSSQINNLASRSELTLNKNNFRQSLKAKKVDEMKKSGKFSIFSNKESKLEVESGSENEKISLWDDEEKIDKITKARDVFKVMSSNNSCTLDRWSTHDTNDQITLPKDVLNMSNSMKSTMKLSTENDTSNNNSPETPTIANTSVKRLTNANTVIKSVLPIADTPKYQMIDMEKNETDNNEDQVRNISREPTKIISSSEKLDNGKKLNFDEDLAQKMKTPKKNPKNEVYNYQNPGVAIKSRIEKCHKLKNDIEVSKLIKDENDLSSENEVLKHFNKVVLNESFDEIENSKIANGDSQNFIFKDDTTIKNFNKKDSISFNSLANSYIEQCLDEKKVVDKNAMAEDCDSLSSEHEVPKDEIFNTFEHNKLKNFQVNNTIINESLDDSEPGVIKSQQKENLKLNAIGIYREKKEKISFDATNNYQNKEEIKNIKSSNNNVGRDFQEVIKPKHNLGSVRYENSREALVKAHRENNRPLSRIINANNKNPIQKFSHESQINTEINSQESVENIETNIKEPFAKNVFEDNSIEIKTVELVKDIHSFSVEPYSAFGTNVIKKESDSKALENEKVGIRQKSFENTFKNERIQKNFIEKLKKPQVNENILISRDRNVDNTSFDQQEVESHSNIKIDMKEKDTNTWNSLSKVKASEIPPSADSNLLDENNIKPSSSHSFVPNTSTPDTDQNKKKVFSKNFFLDDIINKQMKDMKNKHKNLNTTREENKIISSNKNEEVQENLSANELPSFGKAETNEIKKQSALDEEITSKQTFSVEKQSDFEINEQSNGKLSKYSHIGHQVILSTIPAQPTTLRGCKFRFGLDKLGEENPVKHEGQLQDNTSTCIINKEKTTLEATDSLTSKISSNRFNEDSASILSDDTRSTIRSLSKTSVIHLKSNLRQQSKSSISDEKPFNKENDSFEKNMNTSTYQKNKKKFGKNSLKKLFSKSIISINSDYREDSTKLTAWSSKSDLNSTKKNYNEKDTNYQQNLKNFKTTAVTTIKVNVSNRKSNNYTEGNNDQYYQTDTFSNYQNFSFPYQTIQKFSSNNTHISIKAPSYKNFASNANKTTVFNKAKFSGSVTPNQASKIMFTN